MRELLLVVGRLIILYEVVIVVAAVLSWTRADPQNPLVLLVRNVTEPVFERFRRALPVRTGRFDFSPLVALVALEAIRWILHV